MTTETEPTHDYGRCDCGGELTPVGDPIPGYHPGPADDLRTMRWGPVVDLDRTWLVSANGVVDGKPAHFPVAFHMDRDIARRICDLQNASLDGAR